MKKLIKQLSDIPDAYDDFILGVINYAKKNPKHAELLTNYMENNTSLTTSDVIAHIASQSDFHNYSATNKTK